MLVLNLSKSKINYMCIRSVSTAIAPSKQYKEIPGPSSLPVIKQLLHFLPGGSLHNLEGYNFQDHLFKTYGPIVKIDGLFGKPDTVLIFDPDYASEILIKENALPKRPGFFSLEHYRNVVKKEKGAETKYNGLISDHGEKWRELRNAVNPILMQPKSIKAYTEPIEEITADMIARLKHLRNEKNMIDNKFNEEIGLWSVEVAGFLALGRRLNCLDFNLPEDSPTRELIRNVHKFFTLTDKLDYQPSMWRYYPTRTFKKAMHLYEDFEKLITSYVNQAFESYKTEDDLTAKGILGKLSVNHQDKAVAVTTDMFFVGVDSTVNTIIYLLYSLSRNPEKQNLLREEILAKPDRRPYLKATIKESMRLLAIAFGNLRQVNNEYNFNGYVIPKDTMILFCHQYMSLMEKYFPRPHEFLPERWLVPKDDPLYHGNAHPFANVVFGYGARACIGRRVADLMLEIFLTQIMENFRLEWNGEPMKIRQSVINYSEGPFNFVFNNV